MSESGKRKPSFTLKRAATESSLASRDSFDYSTDTSFDRGLRTNPVVSSPRQQHVPNHNASHTSLLKLYTNNNNSSSTILPVQQNAASNVEFNNVRSSFDHQSGYEDHHSLNNNNLHRTTSSSTTLSRLSKDNKFARFITKTADFMKKTPGDNNNFLDLQSSPPLPSVSSLSIDKITSVSGLSSKLKKPESLSIQTTMLPSSKELKSPLARTSKEVERIAAFGGFPYGDKHSTSGANSQQNKSKHKHHYHGLLRSRKDPTKSSSNSNSKLVIDKGGETLYAFHPSAINTTMSVNDLQRTITELEKLSVNNASLSGDKDAIADEAWHIVCNLVGPLFKCERLKTPIEDINKLVYLHISLKTSHDSTSFNSTQLVAPANSMSSPVASPMQAGNGVNLNGGVYGNEPYTPLGMPTPVFANNIGSSPSGSSLNPMSPISGNNNVIIDAIHEFLKSGMNTLMNQLNFEDATQEIKLVKEVSLFMKKGSSPSKPLYTSMLASDHNFVKCCSLLWDFFYNDLFFYLQGIFLPIEDFNSTNDDNGPISPYSSSFLSNDHHNSSASSRPSLMRSSSQGNNNDNNTVRNLILISFRDNIVIPLYEINRQFVEDRDQPRISTPLQSSGIFGISSGTSNPISTSFNGNNTHQVHSHPRTMSVNSGLSFFGGGAQNSSTTHPSDSAFSSGNATAGGSSSTTSANRLGTSPSYNEYMNNLQTNRRSSSSNNERSPSTSRQLAENDYAANLSLLQCLTILNGVQTNDTNQKIVENLMQQSREKCRLYESDSAILL
ncbi:hypothetical protein CANARDRAFT_29281 [[Candida] arabinofermentans NRRL YB-2248]|uniref:Uncharacterized protein n=1 Tax=[Candida] arabinofermentans NRRL YB-2248 TaxID=983967 RepID=A0A1E4SY66_9ASCO|nr:hypothetical protein CANARDRAFT_29281 [[Candida] arabinofermentans NRRL YB-2248]